MHRHQRQVDRATAVMSTGQGVFFTEKKKIKNLKIEMVFQ